MAVVAFSLSANAFVTPGALRRLFTALPCTSLARLELAGCGVSAQACGLLGTSLPRCRIATIDLASNHFKCEGAWSLAWALADSTSLRSLNLSDCMIADDGASELAEALAAAPHVQKIDLRGNKIASGHEIEREGRALCTFQRPGVTR